MSTTPDQIASSILATLATTCPGLSCELGTPERKIVDAVSQAISAAYISNYLTGSLLDIETKTGLAMVDTAERPTSTTMILSSTGKRTLREAGSIPRKRV